MRLNIAITAILLAAALTGCNTVSESDYKLGRTVLAESPTVKRTAIKDCIDKQRARAGVKQREVAAYLNIPVSRFAETVCKRIINAYANGRLTYSDVVNPDYSENSKFIRIMQGK